ncbi:MAG TPA: family 16 glycoside hydrolase, partial [Verrucomicrobiae bacterium]|nr:family 16 glycoside hydrolase [Verrucomicrobiae bacterium]
DFRLHIEFLIMKPGGNSGVYLQNRYEIQVLDGDKTTPGGLKLQAEGHDVRYRNAWIKELDLKEANTDDWSGDR